MTKIIANYVADHLVTHGYSANLQRWQESIPPDQIRPEYMKALLIILLILLAILLWLLLAQIIITIDSRKHLYEFRIASIGWARLKLEEQLPAMELRILFWHGQLKFNPFGETKEKKPKEKKEKSKSKKSRSWKSRSQQILRVLRSFRIEAFRLNMDTDNYYYNSLLYPLFFFARNKNINMNINYQGVSELQVVVKNRPIRILYALFF